MNLAAMYKKIVMLLFIAGIHQLRAQNPNLFESTLRIHGSAL